MDVDLKVLHLSSEQTWRGGEQQIAYLIEELASAGVKNFAGVRKNSAFEAYCQKNGIPFVSLPFRNIIDVESAWKIRSYCLVKGIDVAHLHSAKSHGIAVLSSMLGNPTPLILSRRVDFIPRKNLLARWRYNHPSVKRIIGVSDKITSIMKAYVKDPSRCVTIHSGIDVSKFGSSATDILRKLYNVPAENIMIGNTSALEHHKDYPTFIETIRKLIEKNVLLTAFIIGKGSLRAVLEASVRKNGLERNIIFTGFRSDIPEILPGLDVFLMTSETEGLGTSVLDAFASGVPVVATEAGGIPEMVSHGITGMLAQVGDAETLASHVMQIVGDDTLRRSIIKNAKQKLQAFNKTTTAEKTLAVYRDVVGLQRMDS
jgi:L-malate glycosyltransferase